MKLRKQLFKSIVVQEIAFFDESKTGELLNRLSSDCVRSLIYKINIIQDRASKYSNCERFNELALSHNAVYESRNASVYFMATHLVVSNIYTIDHWR